jgi:hypothetical protein
MKTQNKVITNAITTFCRSQLSCWKDGAGDRDRTGDIQLGKLTPTCRSSQNQAFRTGLVGPNAALAARIEHDSEHNFSNPTGHMR